jgi:hypothetical protein
MRRYAEDTSVSTDKSIGEIRSTLRRYCATNMMHVEGETQAAIVFDHRRRAHPSPDHGSLCRRRNAAAPGAVRDVIRVWKEAPMIEKDDETGNAQDEGAPTNLVAIPKEAWMPCRLGAGSAYRAGRRCLRQHPGAS